MTPPRGAVCAVLALALTGASPPPRDALRVCSDPNNLPFSNERREGFENRIAAILADELDTELEYEWWAQRRGFVRNTLGADVCDVLMGVPAGFDPVLATRPYYRSTFVIVTRRDRKLDIESLDDPRLRSLRISVHLVGDEAAAPPPALALARRGIVSNVHGFSLYDDYRRPNPPARIVEAVAGGEIDAAFVWGPLGGYFARRSASTLRVSTLAPTAADSGLPFTFAIALGVRRGDEELRRRLDSALERRRGDVLEVLRAYGVPLVESGA